MIRRLVIDVVTFVAILVACLAAASWCSNNARAGGFYKAVLVLFVTSDTRPLVMMMGHFPDVFVSKADCQKFVMGARDDIDGTVNVFTKHAEKDFEVLHHEMTCIEDISGVSI